MPAHSAVLGIDIGTGGARALLVEACSGEVLSRFESPYAIDSPQPGWSEQDPRDWWQATCQAIAGAIEQCALDALDIGCVGLTGQMHGLVTLDDQERLIRPAILWNDQRTGEQCAAMHDAIGEQRLIEITGKPALTSFTAPKLLWLRQHEPESWDRIAHVLLPKDAIRLHLTGEHAIDFTDASGTSLLDITSRTWSPDVLAALNIPPRWLPPILESHSLAGTITAQAASETGLVQGTPVIAGAGDQAAAGIACGIDAPGTVSVNLGTSGVVFAACDSVPIDPSGVMHTFCHAIPGTCHLMGCMLSAGGSLEWFHETFAPNTPIDDVCAEAADVPPGCDGLMFAPYLTGERTPHNDPTLTGAFHGITTRHTRTNFTRAVMEGVLFGLNDALDLLRSAGHPVRRVRLTGGGAQSPTWHAMAADVFGCPVSTLTTTDGSAYGAALLAASHVKPSASLHDLMASWVAEDAVADPASDMQALHTRWKAAVHPSHSGHRG